MNFYICLIKTRKKFDKYIKINKIQKKVIIDITKIIHDEHILISKKIDKSYLSILIYNKIRIAKSKNKDVYYIVNTDITNVADLLPLKTQILDETDGFNLLWFYDEFTNTETCNEIMKNISFFDRTQILKDY